MINRRSLVGLGVASLALPSLLRAQGNWPSRNIRIVVPFSAGGGTDTAARRVAAEVSKILDETIIIENKPGAGTVIGVNDVAKSKPDGYSYVAVTGSFTVNETLRDDLPYKRVDDLRPVAFMTVSDHVLVAHPGTGLASIEDIRRAGADGKKLTFGSFGVGSSSHLDGEILKRKLGVEMRHIPYKGQAPALVDLLGGHISMMFGIWPAVREHVESGQLNAIGMATSGRSKFAPDVPSLEEQGVDIVSGSWNGLLAQAGTPDEIVAQMNAAVNEALADPQLVESFEINGTTTRPQSPQEFEAFLEQEIAAYAEVIREADISVKK